MGWRGAGGETISTFCIIIRGKDISIFALCRPSASQLLDHPCFKSLRKKSTEVLPEALQPVTPLTNLAIVPKGKSASHPVTPLTNLALVPKGKSARHPVTLLTNLATVPRGKPATSHPVTPLTNLAIVPRGKSTISHPVIPLINLAAVPKGKSASHSYPSLQPGYSIQR